MATRTARTAHPYDDTAVVDARAPRFLQGTVGVLAAVALLTGWWWLFGLLALQLIAGLVLGRRWCLPCVFYFEVVQPRIGEGRVEDGRPPRFANMLGAGMLSATFLADLAGLRVVGTVLGVIVMLLALLAATTGLCVGCELYRLLARFRGIHPGTVGAIDLAALPSEDLVNGDTVVQFTHPLCADCHELEQRLAAGPRPLVLVDVSQRPDLARRYHVTVVPTAFAVAPDGTVLERLT
ncbi:MAG TPA: DUF4395 family protein [Actinomycetota bacterium]